MLDAIRPAVSNRTADSSRGARGGPSGRDDGPLARLKLGMEAQAAAVSEPAN